MNNELFEQELFKRFEKAYKKQLKDAKHHFKIDGWDLNQSFISQAVIDDAVGVGLLDKFNCFRMARDLGLELVFTQGKGFVFHNPNYIPVSYNAETNQIVEGKFEHTDPWIYLGPI